MVAVVRGMLKSTRFSKDFARRLVTWRIHDELLNNCIDCVYIYIYLAVGSWRGSWLVQRHKVALQRRT